jgi:dienelactone hydrolase
MSGWGRHLAGQGFLTAVPNMPSWSDQARNAHAINELVSWVVAHPPSGLSVDAGRVGLVGFSAGGLATLLAAAENPRIRAWVGLDPVDRDGAGAAAAARVTALPTIITADPSSCNAHGNASGIAQALGDRVTVAAVKGASHADAEWPSDWKARLFCGGTSAARLDQFVAHATEALRRAFGNPRD